MKKNRFLLPIAGIAAYFLLLGLLSYVEKGAQSAQITSFSDALWYSLVTMTTVGYGDVVPQTGLGRVIGCIFLLISLGVLTSLLSLAYSLVVGQLVPKLWLWFRRNKPWHVFPLTNEESIAMAKALKEESPDSVAIFLQSGEKPAGDISISLSPRQILKAAGASVSFYYLGDTTPEICRQAAQLAQTHTPVYCATPIPEYFGPDAFLPAQACARLFWQKHPLQDGQSTIVMIGGQRWMPQLLEQALLVNLFSPDQQLQYHVYGDDGSFQASHYRLSAFCSETVPSPGRDAVCFHDGFPTPDILWRAQRIILCRDTEAENLSLLHTLREAFAFTAELYVRLDHGVSLPEDPRVIPYGTVEALYTPENVVHHLLDETAMKIHQLYCRQNPQYAAPWETLPADVKAANYASADHVLTKLQILLNDRSITELTPEICQRGMDAYRSQLPERRDFFRELEHLRWCRFRYLRNWAYADIPKQDPVRRLHPLLTDFDTLPEHEKQKDDNPWEVIGQMYDSNNG